ncbi:MAG: DUF2163 domain-containing protein [Hyphomicrobiaceae bacterium]
MRNLPASLASSLASGVTTLCWCWRIAPRSGSALGFTDHDRDIVFDGTTFEAASGFTASEIRESVGLSVDNLEVESALSSSRLSEAALAAGDFDDAEVEIYRVDWTDPASRVLVRRGSIGEVRRTGGAFAAEVRGPAHYLQQTKGRVFQYSCDAELGDQRCGINLMSPSHRAEGIVTSNLGDRVFATTDVGDFADGWFTRGLLTFLTGGNAGRAVEVKRHQRRVSDVTLELWQPPGAPLVLGDTFVVTAGCDKQHATCRAKFSNIVNYRGFPHMPGNDFLTTPRAG